MADLHSEGRAVDDKTVEEIISRLEANKNYIPSSDAARKEYAYILLREYGKYVKDSNERCR